MFGERLNLKQLVLILAVLLFLAIGSMALAQNGMPQVNWWTVDGGGGTATGADYRVSGTIGQPEAGGVSEGGPYVISGGFWGAAAVDFGLYLPFVGWQ